MRTRGQPSEASSIQSAPSTQSDKTGSGSLTGSETTTVRGELSQTAGTGSGVHPSSVAGGDAETQVEKGKKRNIVQEQKKHARIGKLVEQYPNIVYLDVNDSCDTCHAGQYRCAVVPSRQKCVSCHTMACTWERTNGVRGVRLVGQCLTELDLIIDEQKDRDSGPDSGTATMADDDVELLGLLEGCREGLNELRDELASGVNDENA